MQGSHLVLTTTLRRKVLPFSFSACEEATCQVTPDTLSRSPDPSEASNSGLPDSSPVVKP